MQEDKRKATEQFLTPENFLELQRLGFKIPFQTKYVWIYDLQDSSKRSLVEFEKRFSGLNPHLGSCPAISFQELLQILPKRLDITVPDELLSYYISSDKIYPGIWRHDLEINFLVTGEIKVGYRWTYYSCSSPLYPFVVPNDDEVIDEYSESGIKSHDWLGAVYELLCVILKDGYYHASISDRNSD
jgi:hypothetical protein